ncbi:ATP-binding cassette domain-containing protein, partial [Rodentibacter sp. Ppn85]
MLKIKSISYQYPNTQTRALCNINLHLPQGTSIGLLGPNGAGKTTLMSLMAGLQS